jgi:hypothetical protein
MRQRGRKSGAALATVAQLSEARPAAPEGLTVEQIDCWADVVTRLPADYFPRETHHLLAEYCRAVTRARFVGTAVDSFKPEWLKATGGVERLAKLVATADRQVRLMAALARSLRITNQARMKAESAARQAAQPTGPFPWDRR